MGQPLTPQVSPLDSPPEMFRAKSHEKMIDFYVYDFRVDEPERAMPSLLSATPHLSTPISSAAPAPATLMLRLFERCLSFPVCAAGAFGVFVYFLIPQSVADPDIWWHLRNAEWQLQAHAFLRQDVFSSTVCGARWINHEWLAELPFYFGWRLLGALGLFLVTVAAIELIFLGVFYLAYLKSNSLMAALAVSMIAALLSTISFAPRTLLFGWICLVAELLVLENFQKHPGLILLLPPLFLIWVNTHGSWMIGMVIFAVFIACGLFRIDTGALQNLQWLPAQRTKLLVAAGVSVLALFANPYGWRLVAYPFDLAFRQKLNIANVEEWRTLDFHSPRGQIVFLVLAGLFLLQVLRRRSWTLCDLHFMAIGVYSAFAYSRFLFLAALLAMPCMATAIAGDGPQTKTKTNRPWANALLLLLLIPLIARHLPSPAALERSGEDRFPLRAVAYLQHFRPQGNVFNDFLWGGFLIWHARQIPVMIDSRVDIFEYNGVFQDYLDAVQLKNTLAILDKYQARYVIFRKDAPLIYLLEHNAEWKVDYEDATTAVLERK